MAKTSSKAASSKTSSKAIATPVTQQTWAKLQVGSCANAVICVWLIARGGLGIFALIALAFGAYFVYGAYKYQSLTPRQRSTLFAANVVFDGLLIASYGLLYWLLSGLNNQTW
jgi:4-hydroxybenzoate polyprenyltransferase